MAIALAGVVAAACQTDRPLDESPDAGGGNTGPDLTGRWAMFVFEDPVAVDLRQSGSVIQGDGCCGGFQDASLQIGCCSAVNGQIVDRRASFGFSFQYFGEWYDYATDVFVSADGRRMAGTFSRGGSPIAWVRIGGSEPSLPWAHLALPEEIGAGAVSYGLVLADDPVPGSDFSAGNVYRFRVDSRFVSGDLGPFWSGEMSWRADEQTLVAGPVPETAPGLPVALSLRFEGATLASVDAAMASGVHYHFQTLASQP